MAQNRVRIGKGMRAFYRGKEYKNGQFLPAAAVTYKVYYYYNPTPMEQARGAQGRQVIEMRVNVEMSKEEVIEKAQRLRDEAFKEKQFYARKN